MEAGDVFYPYCDWFVNVLRCPDERGHRAIKLTALATAVAAVVVNMVYLVLRRVKGHPLVFAYGPGAIDGTVLLVCISFVFRAVDAALIAFDKYPSWVARWVVAEFAWLILFDASVFFLFAVVHSIPASYMDTKGMMRNNFLPPRRVLVGFCLFEALGSLTSIITLAALIGRTFEAQGIGAIERLYTIHYAFWAFFVITLALTFWFYCSRLIIIVQHNYAVAGRSHGPSMERSIRRLKVVIFAASPALAVFGALVVVLAVVRLGIVTQTVSSFAFQFMFDVGVQALVLCATSVMIWLELHGQMDETDRGSSSGGGDRSGRRPSTPLGAIITSDKSPGKPGSPASAVISTPSPGGSGSGSGGANGKMARVGPTGSSLNASVITLVPLAQPPAAGTSEDADQDIVTGSIEPSDVLREALVSLVDEYHRPLSMSLLSM